ncbi:hypothetical protein T09_12778 [Trichinella sp. T9]|nr:hypothetical protein T09_12778 [Trichinella sp. T9]
MITTLRQSSSAGSCIDLSSLWIMSSHEARTAANQCSPGVSMAFSSLSSVPLLITNSKKEFDMTTMKYLQLMALSNCVSYAPDVFPCHARTILYLMSVRNCEDESRILHDVHRNTIMSSRDSVKYWYVASNGLKCGSVEVKVSMSRTSTLSGVRAYKQRGKWRTYGIATFKETGGNALGIA